MSHGILVRENPANTQEILYEIPWDLNQVDSSVAKAKAALRSWDRLGREARIGYLHKFSEALKSRRELIARTIALEAGKPLWEAYTEADALSAKIDIMTGEGAALTADVHPEGLSGGSWRYRPLGPLAVLGPFNFPLHLPNGHIVPALVNGNTVIFKPSEVTAKSAEIYIEAAREAGIPDGVINLVQGPGEVGAALVVHPDIRGVLFTGSYETGLRIKRATLEHPQKLLALEMGGKNTSIILGDAGLEHAAHDIAFAAYMTAGQRCSATSRIILEASVFDEFVERFRDISARVTMGDTVNETTFMGPLATQGAFQKFLDAQQDTENGRLVNLLEGGLARQDLQGYFVSPALWHAKECDARGTHQAAEIFGPDVVLYKAHNDANLVEWANATDFGLAMSIYTRDEERFQDLGYDLETGILNLNRSTCGASSRLPFGGVKQSGNHRPSAVLAGLYTAYPQAQLVQASEFNPKTLDAKPWSLLS
ncbi:aldehyde dehydrogenase family protein [Microvenator marinus]|uniref:Aldehyde dehydrogenase family protein n=1 Tax=Microvenator marinus TaxID=2600177 RepID=A0A5B8XSB1_9DELT|nr:aldehyde dehydrogenase family protein [Microvenator marinus]QED28405.1 aldehyde dehydrogenase family protein [Microvenator marinus]